jgi:hypothetical protein
MKIHKFVWKPFETQYRKIYFDQNITAQFFVPACPGYWKKIVSTRWGRPLGTVKAHGV